MTTTENKKAGKLPFSPMVRAFLRKNGEIYVEAQSKLRGTGSVSSEPYFSHTIKDNVLELGTSVLKAKAGSLSYLDRYNYLDYVPPYYEWAALVGFIGMHIESPYVYAYNNAPSLGTDHANHTQY